MEDWLIAQKAEKKMKNIHALARETGILKEELIPMGRNLAKIDAALTLKRLKNKRLGKFITITAITPTRFGEGKTTTAIGLVQGLGQLGKRVCGAIRQPSSGPTFNIKGSAAGGGYSQCIPLSPFSIRLTGDIDSVTNAHNLAMVALTARMQHEKNYDDARLKKNGLRRLDIDPRRICWKWAMDFCAQALRNITIGKGSKMDGFLMNSGFQISVSSEIMAILSIARDLKDLRKRIASIVLAYSKAGKEITARDMEVDGAMTAWLIDAINPNLLQTIEGQPIFVHGGPFANIAIGQSSIIADRLGLALCDYHVTESGFGADIGYEKLWNLKCRLSDLKPNAVVIVATVRALKAHGDLPGVKPALRLEKGCGNLIHHINIVRKSGITPIVCINKFREDTKEEIELVRQIALQNKASAALSQHWEKGGRGAIDLAKEVIKACENRHRFKYLYKETMSLKEQILLIAQEVYGAKKVTYSRKALLKIKALGKAAGLLPCMAKTHLSLSHDPQIKESPKNWTLPINDILVYKGAGFVVPVAGGIKLMPGTGSNPAYRRIDINTRTGQVKGLY